MTWNCGQNSIKNRKMFGCGVWLLSAVMSPLLSKLHIRPWFQVLQTNWNLPYYLMNILTWPLVSVHDCAFAVHREIGWPDCKIEYKAGTGLWVNPNWWGHVGLALIYHKSKCFHICSIYLSDGYTFWKQTNKQTKNALYLTHVQLFT